MSLVALGPCTVLYCMLLYSTVLYSNVLYCILLLRGAPLSRCGKFGSSVTLYCTLLYSTVLYYCTILYLIALTSSPPHATPKYQISWESVLWFQCNGGFYLDHAQNGRTNEGLSKIWIGFYISKSPTFWSWNDVSSSKDERGEAVIVWTQWTIRPI